ncbi:MAG: hypothetical protein GY940_01175, partial [bacterium]|nr:hypothetical protein [bacterium]
MMRKINFFWLFILTAVLLFPVRDARGAQAPQTPQGTNQAKKKKPRKLNLEIAYAFKKESLLISDTDLRCTHFIRQPLSDDLRIIGSELMDWGKIDYSDSNRMYINQGSNDGITEEDIFMVLAIGSRIRSPVTGKQLGTYHLKKSLAKIYCIYENNAIITLMKGCHPVQIGDILIPYKAKNMMFEEKLIYTNCRLPVNGIEGNVVYQDIYTGFTRELVSFSQYVSIDLGKAMVSVGEWVLFYRRIKPNLPPIIIGTGVVINTQNTSSTVVVMDSAFEVELLNKVVLLGKHQPQKKMTTRTG